MTLLGAASILNPGIIKVRPFVRTLLAYKTPSSSPADAWAKVSVKFKKNTLELWRSYESAPKQAK